MRYALHRAVQANDTAKCLALLAEGYYINDLDNQGRSVLSLAYQANNLTLIDLLLQQQANPNLARINNKTLLCVAVEDNNLILADKLIEHGADLAQFIGYCSVPARLASYPTEVINYILDNGANSKPILAYALAKNDTRLLQILQARDN